MSDASQYIPGLGRGVTISGSDIGANTVTSSNVDPKFGQYVSVVVTAAQIAAMSTTPVLLIPTAGTATAPGEKC